MLSCGGRRAGVLCRRRLIRSTQPSSASGDRCACEAPREAARARAGCEAVRPLPSSASCACLRVCSAIRAAPFLAEGACLSRSVSRPRRAFASHQRRSELRALGSSSIPTYLCFPLAFARKGLLSPCLCFVDLSRFWCLRVSTDAADLIASGVCHFPESFW